MSKKVIIGVIAVVVAATIVFSGCKGKDGTQETVKIGAILSLTGDNALQGNLAKNGILLAIAEINSQGGINGKKIDLIIEDSQTSAKGTVNAFKKLQSDNVVALISTGDIEFQAINPVSQRSEIAIMATTCTGMLDNGRNPLLFRYCFNEELQDSLLMAFAKNDLGLNRITLSYPNNLWGKEISTYTKKYFENMGGKIISEVEFDLNSNVQRSLAVKIVNDKPDAICVRGFGTAFEAMLRSIKEQRYTGILLGDITFSLPGSLNNTQGAIENSYLVSIDLDVNSTDPFIKSYVERYKQKYNEIPSIWDAFGYDSFLFLAKGIEISETNKTSIPEALYSIDSIKLLLGNNRFNNKNDAAFEMSIYKVENGEVKKYK